MRHIYLLAMLMGCSTGGGGAADGGALDPATTLPSQNPLLGSWLHVADSTGRASAEGGALVLTFLASGRASIFGQRPDRDLFFSSTGEYRVDGATFAVEFARLANGTEGGAFTLEGDALELPFRAITDMERGDDGTSSWRRLTPDAGGDAAAEAVLEAAAVATDAWYVYAAGRGAGRPHGEAGAEAAAWLRGVPGVGEVGVDAEGLLITFTHPNGEVGRVLLRPLEGAADGVVLKRRLSLGALDDPAPVPRKSPLITPAPGLRSALIVAPFQSLPICHADGRCEFMGNWTGYPVPDIRARLTEAGYRVDLLHSHGAGADAVYDALARDYAVIVFVTHGNVSTRSKQVFFLLGDIIGVPGVLTDAAVDPVGFIGLRDRYGADNLWWMVEGTMIYTAAPPGFFALARAQHGTDYTDTLVYALACHSSANPSMRDRGFGARFYVGYERTVSGALAYPSTRAFFQRLANAPGSTVWEAFDQGFNRATCTMHDADGYEINRARQVTLSTEQCPCTPQSPPCAAPEDCPVGVCDPVTHRCRCNTDAHCPGGQRCAPGDQCTDCYCHDSSDARMYQAFVGGCDAPLPLLPLQTEFLLAPTHFPGEGDPCHAGFDVSRSRYATQATADARCARLAECYELHWQHGQSGGLADADCHGDYPGADAGVIVDQVNGLLCGDPAPMCEQFSLLGYPDEP